MKGCEVYFQRRFHGRRRCRIVRSLMAYTGRLLPKGALTLLRLTLTLTDKRSLGEVHERVWKALEKRGKSVYHQTRFRAVEKATDINVLVYGDLFTLKDSAVKRDAKFQTRYVKGVPFVNRRIPFLSKVVYQGDPSTVFCKISWGRLRISR